jgi:hypothetical protein
MSTHPTTHHQSPNLPQRIGGLEGWLTILLELAFPGAGALLHARPASLARERSQYGANTIFTFLARGRGCKVQGDRPLADS